MFHGNTSSASNSTPSPYIYIYIKNLFFPFHPLRLFILILLLSSPPSPKGNSYTLRPTHSLVQISFFPPIHIKNNEVPLLSRHRRLHRSRLGQCQTVRPHQGLHTENSQ